MTGWWRSWRASVRLARREARRARGRSILVVAMIALPVAGMAFAAVNYATFQLSPALRADRLMGAGDALIGWPTDGVATQHPTDPKFFGTTINPDGAPPRDLTAADLLALLPPGSRVIDDRDAALTVRTAAGTGTLVTRLLDYADPLARGIYRPLSGRAPAAADEVALTPAAAQRLGLDQQNSLGGTVQLADGSRTFRVVGTVEDPGNLKATTIVLRPDALPAPATVAERRAQARWLVDTPGPLTWADVRQLNTHGIVATSRYVLANPPPPDEIDEDIRQAIGGGVPAFAVSVLIVGLAVLEVVLLAGPAFAVSARRRRRELALIAATGATPRQLRRMVLADGVVLGVLAAAVGTTVGVVVATTTVPWFETVAGTRAGPIQLYPSALAGLAVLAVLTGVLAAVVPAWSSSRQDVITALAGRRGTTRSRRRWIVLGAGLGAVGVAVAAAGAWRVEAAPILIGMVVVELGLILCTPALVGLIARGGRWLPLAPRIAMRDTSRNRTAAAPAISAVMGVVVISMALGVVVFALNDRERTADRGALSRPGDIVLTPAVVEDNVIAPEQPHPVPPAAVAELRRLMPVDEVHEIGRAMCDVGFCEPSVLPPPANRCPYIEDELRRAPTRAEQRAARRDPRCDDVGSQYTYFGVMRTQRGPTLVIQPEAAGTVANLSPADAELAEAALRAGKIVVDHPRALTGDQVTLFYKTDDGSGGVALRTMTAPGFAVPHPRATPFALMTAETARSLGLTAGPLATLATTTRMPTQEEQDRLAAALTGNANVLVIRGPYTDDLFLLVLAIVAGVITIAAAAIATGLAAAEGRADLGTLAAVGASPGVRRLLTLSQTGVIAGLGSVLGVLAGVGASTAVLFALNRRSVDIWPEPALYPIHVPWLNVLVALVGVPLIAMLGTGLLTRARLPIERRL